MAISKGLLATVLLAGITILVGEASQADRAAIERPQTQIPEAREEYELGRQEFAERSVGSVRRAKRHFERAIELDPEYAQAYVGLADAISLMTWLEQKDPAASLDERQAAIDRALEIDANLGEAYASLGLLRQNQGEIEEAEENFLKAIELSPDYATAYKWYANLLSCHKDRNDDSLRMLRKAATLEPGSPIIQDNLARALMKVDRADEAKTVVLAGLEQNPNSAILHGVMSDIFRWSDQRFDESLRWARAATRLDPLNPTRKAMECQLLLQLGMDDAAETCLDAWEAGFPDLPDSTMAAARRDLYLMREQPREAVEYLRQFTQAASNEWSQWLLGETYALNGEFLKARPIYEALRPEFFEETDVAFPPYNLGSAIVVGQILYNAGEQEAANKLFDRALEIMSTIDRELYGYLDANIYMTRGQNEAAIAALRAAYEARLFAYWWYLKAPVYGVMETEPEWNEAVGQFLAEIERQREHYQRTKDDPLM